MSQNKIPRNFIQTEFISKHLLCIFCQDTFYDPTRLGCGHTYCKECISKWKKSNTTCPICRKKIVKNQISQDIIANNIINDLIVTCNNKTCPWKGSILDLVKHMSYCVFDIKNIPDEIKNIFEKEIINNSTPEFNIEINNNYSILNSQSSLKARLYEKHTEIMKKSLMKNNFKDKLEFDIFEEYKLELNFEKNVDEASIDANSVNLKNETILLCDESNNFQINNNNVEPNNANISLEDLSSYTPSEKINENFLVEMKNKKKNTLTKTKKIVSKQKKKVKKEIEEITLERIKYPEEQSKENLDEEFN